MVNKVNKINNSVALKRLDASSGNTQNTTEPTDSYNTETKVEEEGKKKKWLVIHYGAGDNNLVNYIFSDVDELEKVGSDVNTHIVSVLDLGNLSSKFKGARIFYLKQDNKYGVINSPVLKNLGQVNMADPVFMANVLKEIIKRFPSDHIAIFIGDHGSGWKGAVEDDSSSGKFMKIGEIREALESVVKEIGKKIDLLAFDACLMAMAEVGYELKDAVKYMVASEQLEGGGGYNYTKLFSKAMADALKSLQQASLLKINVGPEEFAKLIVDASKEYSYDIETISAVDLEKVKDLADAINSFAETVINKFNEAQLATVLENYKKLAGKIEELKGSQFNYDKILEVIKNYNTLLGLLSNLLNTQSKADPNLENEVEKLKDFNAKVNELLSVYSTLSLSKDVQDLFSELNTTDAKKIKDKINKAQQFYSTFRDLKDFMKLIVEDKTISEDVRNKAQEVIKKLDEYVLAEFHVGKYPGANGVTIELPSWGAPVSAYQETLFAKDTKWDEMLKKINKA